MAAILKQTILLAVLTVAYVRVSTTDLVPLTGDHVCARKTCVAVERNETYVGCPGCPRDQEPPTDDSMRGCGELPFPGFTPPPTPTPSPAECSTARRQTCYHTVTRHEQRSANVRHCCPGYVEKEDGKCIRHHLFHHMACQMMGARVQGFRPWTGSLPKPRCGRNARCVVDHCVCARGYVPDSEGYHCVDIDECVTLWPCEQYCINTDGGYYCECGTLHELHSNLHNCTGTTSTTTSRNAPKATSTTTTRPSSSTTESKTTPGTSNEGAIRGRTDRLNASTSPALITGLLAGAALVVLVAVVALFYIRRQATRRQPAGGDTEHSAYMPPGGVNAIIIPRHPGHLAFENHLYQDLPPLGHTAN
ncbi:hypothetical protein LSAT2_004429 [Lamellibrachia satsuma]|nr:hypothetical protein LSAT2_004429 [Lamellibrachia satsuma]